MRRLALAAAVALAACSVELEGARCATDANCPGTQRCDVATQACVTCVADPACTADGTFCIAGDTKDIRTCSTTAGGCRYALVSACPDPETCQGATGQASCGCPQSGSSAGTRCSSIGAQACDPVSRNAIACVSRGSCQLWEPAAGTTCTSQGLVCDASGGAPTCVCDAYSGTDLYADPVSGKRASDAVKPTGAATPLVCRFRSLTDALAAATSGKTVRMAGWSSGEVVFSAAASGETFPLQPNPSVTLSTADATPTPAHYVIEVDQPSTIRPVLQLDHDTGASGFTIRPAMGGSATQALWVNCTGPGTAPVAISDLVLNGKGSLAASAVDEGLRLSGPCSVSVSSLLVENAAKAGVRVLSSSTAIFAPTVSVARCTIRRNGDGGLVVDVDATFGRPFLSLTGNDVTLNGATTAYTDGATTRRGGGVVLARAVPQGLVFRGNEVHGNTFDQVLVYSSGAWALSAASCGAASNTLACYDSTNSGVGLSALGGATVIAHYDVWKNSTPMSGQDYAAALGSSVDVGTVSCGASALSCP